MTVTDHVPEPDEDRETERAVLGAMLTSRDAIADSLDVVYADDFADGAHQALYWDIIEVYGAEGTAGVDAVLELRAKRGRAAPEAVVRYLRELAKAAASSQQLPELLRHVRGSAVLRRLGQAADIIGEAATSLPQDADTALGDAIHAVMRAGGRELLIDTVPLCDLLEAAIDQIEHAGTGKMAGVPTGFAGLDELTGGLHPGQLVVVAGRPALGKTTLGLDLLRSCAIKNGLTAALFTGQSQRDEVVMRLLAAECRVGLHYLRRGELTDDDWARVARRMGDISAAPLFINHRPRMTLGDIEAECRKLRFRHGLRLAVVDTINLVRYGRRFDSRYLEVSEVAAALKRLARELEITIVVTAELNRGVEHRPEKVPVLTDLRDSGILEEVADLVVLLFRDDAYERWSVRAGEADLIVAKHREGPTATITVAHQGAFSRFVDMAPPPGATDPKAGQVPAPAESPEQAAAIEEQAGRSAAPE